VSANPENDRKIWIRAAKRLALRRNVAFWSDTFFPVALGVTVLAAFILLFQRVMGWPTRVLWSWWGAALLAAAAIAAGRVGRRHFTVFEALVRLDEVGQLRNRLTSAFHGVGPWPPWRSGMRDSVRWSWPRVGIPVLAGGLLLTAVSWVEIPKLRTSARPNEEPIAWTQVESWLKTLEQAKLLEQPALDKLQQQLDDLQHQPEQDWYSQSSLEAGDALQEQTAQALREMRENLDKSADLLALAQHADEMPGSQLQNLSAALKDLGAAMMSGALPLNSELAGKLRSFDPSSLKAMSQEQLQALRDKLADGTKICSQCVGPKTTKGEGVAKAQEPQGPPWGGKTAPLGLDENAEDLHTKRMEGASNEDPRRALPGEVLAIAKGQHNVNKTNPAGLVDGGAASSAGQGGDAVWRDSLTPAERQVLQKYFK